MHALNRILLLLTYALCLLLHGAFAVPSDADPDSPASAAPTPADLICHPNKPCYPRTFVPTTTFLPVAEDQVVPPGLHIRLNIGTGGREAKLIDPAENSGTEVYVDVDKAPAPPPPGAEYSDLIVVPDQDTDHSSVLNGGRSSNDTEDDDKSAPPVQHIPPEPESHKPNPHLSTTDWETFHSAVEVLSTSSYASPKSLTEALQKLSDMSHEPEYGVKLIELSLKKLISILSSSDYSFQIRSLSAITLGNSLQNNAVALSKVKKLLGANTKEILVTPLLQSLLKNEDVILTRRLMFALSRTVRIHHAKQDFLSSSGLSTLEKVYKSTSDLPLRGKIAAFLQDEFLDVDMMELEIKPGSEGKNQKVMRVKDDLSGWCEILQSDLVDREKEDLDSEVKVLVTLKALREKYGESDCKAKEGIKGWLSTEREKIRKEEGDDGDWITVPLEGVEDVFFGVRA